MTLIRQTIREYVVAQLVAGDTSAETRVYNARLIPLESSGLPLINVMTGNEEVDPGSSGYSHQGRRVKKIPLLINAIIKAVPGEEIGNEIDDLCEEITDIINPDFNLNKNVVRCEYIRTTVSMDSESSYPFAFAVIEYECEFVE